MELYEKITLCYQYCYSKVSGNKSFLFSPRGSEVKLINSFCELLEEHYGKDTVDINFLFSFFVFQFEYWHDKETRFGKGRVMLNWVIGPKSFERWCNRHEKWDYFSNEFAREYGINKSDVLEIVNYVEKDGSDKYDIFSNIENTERRRFHNTERGFLNCIQLTTMYNNKTKWCILCKNSASCKKALKSKYPGIYSERYGNAVKV